MADETYRGTTTTKQESVGTEMQHNLREIAAREAEQDMMRETDYEHHETELLDTHDAAMPTPERQRTPAERMGENDEKLKERTRGPGRRGMHSKGSAEGGKRSYVAGTVEAEKIDIRGAVAMARSKGDSTVQGASGVVVSAGTTSLTGGSGVVVSGGDTLIRGGVPVLVNGGKATLEKSGALVAFGNQVKVGDKGYVGIAITPKMKVKEGGRVLIGMVPAILLGAAFGAAFALVGALIRGWRPDTDTIRKQARRTAKDAQSMWASQTKRVRRNPNVISARRAMMRAAGQEPDVPTRMRDWFWVRVS